MAKAKVPNNNELKLAELTLDLQRTRADFENYRKRVEAEKHSARASGEVKMAVNLLPVIDTIERALTHMPAELANNQWAQGIVGISKQLEKQLTAMNLKRIDASVGALFDPHLHQAVQMDEEAEGEHEVIAEELQAGYMLGTDVLRHSMVKVTRN